MRKPLLSLAILALAASLTGCAPQQASPDDAFITVESIVRYRSGFSIGEVFYLPTGERVLRIYDHGGVVLLPPLAPPSVPVTAPRPVER